VRLDAAHIGRIATRAAISSLRKWVTAPFFDPHMEAFSSHCNGTLTLALTLRSKREAESSYHAAPPRSLFKTCPSAGKSPGQVRPLPENFVRRMSRV
jgi:hypothetical protein